MKRAMSEVPLNPELEPQAMEGETFALREYWNIVLKRLWTIILVFVLVVTGVALYTFQQPRIYEAKTTVIIDFEPPKVFGRAIEETVSQPGHWLMQTQYFETQLRVIKSRKIAERVVREHGLAENLEFLGLSEIKDEEALARALEDSDPAQHLLDIMEVEPVKDTRMVYVKVQHSNKKLAAVLANAVAEAYKAHNLESRLDSMRDAFHWLERQYRAYDTKVSESNEALRKFKADHQLLFTNPGEQQAIVNNKLNQLNSELIRVEASRRHSGYVLEEIKSFEIDNLGSAGLGLLSGNENLDSLTKRYIDLKQELTKAKSRFLDSQSEVQSVERRVEIVEDAIKAEVRSIRQGYEGVQSEICAPRSRQSRPTRSSSTSCDSSTSRSRASAKSASASSSSSSGASTRSTSRDCCRATTSAFSTAPPSRRHR